MLAIIGKSALLLYSGVCRCHLNKRFFGLDTVHALSEIDASRAPCTTSQCDLLMYTIWFDQNLRNHTL